MLVHGSGQDAEALHEEIADVLAPLGLRLSEAKTQIAHMSEGFELPRVPHPVATQAGNEQALRLHLHRRPARSGR